MIAGAVAIVAAQLSLGPTAAPAGTVSLRPNAEPINGWDVAFDAAPGERNQLEIRDTGSPTIAPHMRSWQVSDSGAPLSPGEHCTAIDEHTAQCGSAMFNSLVFGARIALGDQDDWLSVTSPVPEAPSYYGLRVTAEGGAGNDRLYGGASRDDLRGGGGRDELYGNAGNDMLTDGDRDGATDERAPAADHLDGGVGDDLVSYHARKSPVAVDLADPRPDGAVSERDVLTAIESIVGGRGRDRLAGDDGPNVIDGGGGRDRLSGRDGDDELAFRNGFISCGRGADAVNDNSDTPHGRLVGPRARNELGHLQPDCETFRPKGDYPGLPAYPARLRPSWVGYRVSCDDDDGEVVACSGAVRLTETLGRRRLLGSRAFPRGRWTGRMVRVRLTPVGRRLASRRRGVRATINIRGARSGSPLRWTIRLKVPG